MLIETNPLKWFSDREVQVKTDVPAKAEESKMSVLTVMEKVGKDIKLGFEEVVEYLPTAAKLAEAIFPAQTAAITGVVNSVDLVQKAVVTVEQKFAAAGVPTGTGTQKMAQVLTMVTPTVTQLLAAEKVPMNTSTVTGLVNAVVAILNVRTLTAEDLPVAA